MALRPALARSGGLPARPRVAAARCRSAADLAGRAGERIEPIKAVEHAGEQRSGRPGALIETRLELGAAVEARPERGAGVEARRQLGALIEARPEHGVLVEPRRRLGAAVGARLHRGTPDALRHPWRHG